MLYLKINLENELSQICFEKVLYKIDNSKKELNIKSI